VGALPAASVAAGAANASATAAASNGEHAGLRFVCFTMNSP
jgi:hypothetical protein